jgi:hypothetical protein
MASSIARVPRDQYGRGGGSYATSIPKTCELDHIRTFLIRRTPLSGVLTAEQQTPVCLRHQLDRAPRVAAFVKRAAACTTNFAAKADPATQDARVRRAGRGAD